MTGVLTAGAPGLWDWSLAVYAHPGVPAACLEAQDRHGAYVNLLLWAAWLGAVHGHLLTPGEAAGAEAATSAWRQDVVRPLRALRRRLKFGPSPAPDPATAALREKIKAAELEAERIELARLEGLVPAPRRDAAPQHALAANLALLLGQAAPSVVAAFRDTAALPE